MRIHAICTVRNEQDIVEHCLRAANEWCDAIYVYDNGSTDRTNDIVVELATQMKGVFFYKSDDRPFYNGLRAELFDRFRSRASAGDWWCRLDADEFYIDNPRVFLAKVASIHDTVWSASFQYYFTDVDLARYDKDPTLYADFIPPHERYRYYRNNWGEMRFFRYHDDLVWDDENDLPCALRSAYPVRVWLRHYQYRSPQQIQDRLHVRRKSRVLFAHEAQKDWQATITGEAPMAENVASDDIPEEWRERVVNAALLDYDHHDYRLVVREDEMPPIVTRSISHRIGRRLQGLRSRLL